MSVNPEAFREVIVICRRGSDYLRPGYVRGYKCYVCGLPLQVSAQGVEHIRKGAKPLCNEHGLTLWNRVERGDFPAARELSEGLQQQLAEMIAEYGGGHA